MLNKVHLSETTWLDFVLDSKQTSAYMIAFVVTVRLDYTTSKLGFASWQSWPKMCVDLQAAVLEPLRSMTRGENLINAYWANGDLPQ